jgi:hypothetical protein
MQQNIDFGNMFPKEASPSRPLSEKWLPPVRFRGFLLESERSQALAALICNSLS